MEAKDLIPIVSAFYTYKAKLAEKASPIPQPTPVKILSLRDRPPTNLILPVAKGGFYIAIAASLFTVAQLLLFWSYIGLGVRIFLLATLLVAPLSIFILFKLSGDVSKRSSRTKYDTTVTVMAPYDAVFTRCKDIIQGLKATIVLVDYDGGMIESVRGSIWHVPFKLNVQVSRVGDDRCSVYVESDATMPTVFIDFGMNARRVRGFVRDLTL